ncbi:hypothetical protein DACRYDRAFT_19910 [Dacryopinax primogenitus]|uniref:Mid2 domain-containing protein n=1 Tax=Dacryopinax primogenitus (strain DJM 731) TaxID=1858805 RepID=M5G9D4_DACPD|nr:uncharacterized protein DACRYDRAFT_19910 [Dacryopinax primogenitus]EJU05399.1 hypothetical protein DACRYDRAFT_19910 [Dacryopinax primogenitus]
MALENSIWNLTVSAISPMFAYDFFTGDSSTGWATTCTEGDAYACDGHTAHVTGAAGSISVTFNGNGIAFYGNVTNSMTVTLSIDGGGNVTEAFDSVNQVLGSAQGLSSGAHTALLSVSPSSPAALLFFNQAVISYDTGLANAQPDITYVDDLNPSISYGAYWFDYPNYTNSSQSNATGTFHASNAYNTTASLRFNASAVLLYGPCYAATGLFEVDVTPGPGTTVLNTTAAGPQVGAHVFQNCLRYFAMGLDPTVERTISMTNIENGTYATLDYVELVGLSSAGPGASGSGASGTTGGGGSSGTNIGPIVGGVVGGVGGLCLILLLFLLYRRHQQKLWAQPEPFGPRMSLDQADSEISPALATGSSIVPLASGVGSGSASQSRPRPESQVLSVGGTPSMSQKQALMAHYALGQRARAPPSDFSAPNSVDLPSAPVSGSTPSAPSSAAGPGASTTALVPAVGAAGVTASPSQPSPRTQPSPTNTSIHSPYAATIASNVNYHFPSPSLRQISSDVNRIIAELSRFGRPPAPGGTGEEDLESELDLNEGHPGPAPPAYDQSHGGNQLF